MKIPGLNILTYIVFVAIWIWLSRSGLEVVYIGIFYKIDLFTVSIGRFNKCLQFDKDRPRKTPLNNLWRYFSFIRDFFAMMATWKLIAQLLSVFIYKRMTLDEISITFLTAEFVRHLLIDLLIIWVAYMLELLTLVQVLAVNVSQYCRLYESMEFLHELRLNLNAGLRDKSVIYAEHLVKHAWTGCFGANTNFLIDLFCMGKLELSRILSTKFTQALPAIYQILVLEELAPTFFTVNEDVSLNLIKIVAILGFAFQANFDLVYKILSGSTSWFHNLMLADDGLINKLLADGDLNKSSKTENKAKPTQGSTKKTNKKQK